MRSFIVAAVASLVAASPASAEGLRAELHAGWDNFGGNGNHEDGVVYGIGLGYDALVGERLLLGIEANLDDSSIKECATAGTGAGATRSCINAGRDISVNGRIGYKVSEAGTLYGLAGYTNARVKARVTTGATTVRTSANLDGVRLGAGYEHAFGQNLYGKVEYRYSNYEAGADRHQVLTGVGIRF